MTPKHKSNLAKLALWTFKNKERIEDRFRMINFCFNLEDYDSDPFGFNDENIIPPKDHKCSTAACYMGHGPMAGIIPNTRLENWDKYGEAAFGLARYNKGGEIWRFLFEMNWPDDPVEAVKRTSWFFEGKELFDPGREPKDWEEYQINFKLLKNLLS